MSDLPKRLRHAAELLSTEKAWTRARIPVSGPLWITQPVPTLAS